MAYIMIRSRDDRWAVSPGTRLSGGLKPPCSFSAAEGCGYSEPHAPCPAVSIREAEGLGQTPPFVFTSGALSISQGYMLAIMWWRFLHMLLSVGSHYFCLTLQFYTPKKTWAQYIFFYLIFLQMFFAKTQYVRERSSQICSRGAFKISQKLVWVIVAWCFCHGASRLFTSSRHFRYFDLEHVIFSSENIFLKKGPRREHSTVILFV